MWRRQAEWDLRLGREADAAAERAENHEAASSTLSHDLSAGVANDLLADELDQLLHDYHQQRLKTEKEILLTMDGKTLRGTIHQGKHGARIC